MDAIGISTPPIVKTTTAAPALPAVAASALPAPAEVKIPTIEQNAAPDAVDLQVAEQKRLQAVQRAAQNANNFAVSDKTFTIFKDVTGQYITRFTSLRDGKVTYIPEPELLKSNNSATDVSLLNITA
ncbi:MAG: hypothetical protein EBR02_03295 [Alphaproteobacteria bacterium]|nr:hypothetical protein [Alphaproteobacteria bacterium]